ncbi:MAG: tetratricopeptide repeat protein [Bacteroidia bacterium]|nr:tetratricopeptide repeat protein [Bacteroidia bacterium]
MYAQTHEKDSLTLLLDTAKGSNRVQILNNICYKYRFSDPELAMRSGSEGLFLAKKINDQKNLVLLFNNLGLLYKDKSADTKALENFIAGENTAEKINDKYGIAMSNHNIGILYQTQKLYEKALISYTTALELFKEIDNKNAVAQLLNSFGALSYELDDKPKALDYFLQSLAYMEEIDNKKGIADGLNNVAIIYEEMKNYSKALEYHNRSLNICREQSDNRGVSTSLFNMALVYQSQNSYDNAISYIDSAIYYAEKVNGIDLLKEYYRSLSDIYFSKNDYKTSLDFYRKSTALNDSLINQDRNKQILEMSTKYQTEKKEKENELLKQQNELQNLSLNRQRIINYSVTFGLLLVLGLAFFIYKGYKQKQIANKQLEEKNVLIEEKNKIVEEKNKDITDSIRYARRLQTAILKPENTFNNYFRDGFILFKPKDIVSGDFYWFEKFGNLSLVAAADCTGHGVPGAFMSIIGCNLLSQSVNEYAITQPAAILNSINKGLTKVLQQKRDSNDFVTDGMDIALCAFNPDTMMLEYSGAYNPMWLIRNNELKEISADKFPVGAFIDSQERLFTRHELPVQQGDMIYIFSDGFADQFGGPAGKKFKYKQFQKTLLENHTKSCEDQKEALNTALTNWMGPLEQVDDVLVIGIRI